MNSQTPDKQGNNSRTETPNPERRPEGKEGAGAHQEGPGSRQADQTNRRAVQDLENGPGQDNQSGNRTQGQRTVSGKNQTGPAGDRAGDRGGNHGNQGQNYRAGGDQSDRAARSGATGERNPEGAQNRPQPKNQDEKGMGTPRNR